MVSSVCDRSVFAAKRGRWVTVMNELCACACGSVYVFVFAQQKTGCEIHEMFFSVSVSQFFWSFPGLIAFSSVRFSTLGAFYAIHSRQATDTLHFY